MEAFDPIRLLFGGMAKLGPGADAQTLQVLRGLPMASFRVVVDAGCGAGRQTLVLAKELATTIHAVDVTASFLDELARRAAEAGVGERVQTHCMDMQAIPEKFRDIDLLWSEGAAYSIGLANALATWAPTVRPGGFVVLTELMWLTEQPPAEVHEFFRTGYPDMRTVAANVAVAEQAGYQVRATHTLPPTAWVEGYYDVLEPRAKALLEHVDPLVREFAAGTLQEIATFQRSAGSYGYVFLVLQRPA